MLFTHAYKTFWASQGEVRAAATREVDWKPPTLIQQLDAQLPDAMGVMLLHEQGRTSVEHVVFRLPQKWHENVYFHVCLDLDGFNRPEVLTLRHVSVYASPPSIAEGLFSDGMNGKAVQTLTVKDFAELRASLTPETLELILQTWKTGDAMAADLHKLNEEALKGTGSSFRCDRYLFLWLLVPVVAVFMYLVIIFVAGGTMAVGHEAARLLGNDSNNDTAAHGDHHTNSP